MQAKPQIEPEMDETDDEFWASFSEEERLALDQAIAEADAGLGIPHEEVMAEIDALIDRIEARRSSKR